MTFHNLPAGPDMMAYAQGGQNNFFQAVVSDHSQSHAMQHMIDPRLSQVKPGPPQMERYLLEANKTFFSAPRTQPGRDAAAPFYGHPSEFIAHLPPGSVGRHGSPMSQQNSPASSGAQSPPTESDLCHEGTQGPSTPPDITAVSPFAHVPYDYLENQSMQFPFAGLMPDDACVSMSDINPVHNLAMDHHDAASEPPIDFSVDGGFGMDDTSSPQLGQGFFMQQPPMPHQAPSDAGSHARKPHDLYPDSIVEDIKAEDDGLDMSISVREDLVDFAPSARVISDQTAPGPRRSRRASMTSSPKRARTLKHTVAANGRPKTKLMSTTSALNVCTHCGTAFKDELALQKHTKQQHTRPFTCVFHYAGCTSTFATKNEWKRHVVSQHLALNYWLCDTGACAKTTGPSTQQRSASLPTYGAIFNRKDLYTQHVRRMHAPAHARKAAKTKKPHIDWDDRLRTMQDNAKKDRCALPTYMRCPAPGCDHISDGPNAWDDRMEHVGRHLERAAAGEEAPVYFGGPDDPTLTDWAERPGVDVVRRTAIGWELCNPLKGEGSSSRKTSAGHFFEEDAEGEDC